MVSYSRNFFRLNSANWHYHQFGQGSKSLIAMHGFGQNGLMFEPIATAFAEKYTIYAFDFINHGKTEWNSSKPCTNEMWAEMLDAFAKEKGIETYSLMGFSMGGKILLHSLPLIKTPVESIFPMAMDGVKLSFYHKPYLKKTLPHYLVKKLIFNAAWSLKLLPVLRKMSLISRQASDFMHYYFENERRRMRSYMVWKSMLYFLLPLEEIVEYIQNQQIKTYIFFGEKDKILSPKLAVQLHEMISDSKLHLVDEGHFIVNESLNPIFRHILDEQ